MKLKIYALESIDYQESFIGGLAEKAIMHETNCMCSHLLLVYNFSLFSQASPYNFYLPLHRFTQLVWLMSNIYIHKSKNTCIVRKLENIALEKILLSY